MQSTVIIWEMISKIPNKMTDCSPLFNSLYPRFMRLEDVVISDEHLGFTMDFSNALNSAPYTALLTMSMPAVYSLFRNMGMRVSRLTLINFKEYTYNRLKLS